MISFMVNDAVNAYILQFLGLLVRARGLASQVNEAEFELSVSTATVFVIHVGPVLLYSFNFMSNFCKSLVVEKSGGEAQEN